MRVGVLGGAGDMGSSIARNLVSTKGVEKVLVADIDQEKGRALAAQLGEVANYIFLDAKDEASLDRLFRSCDVVVSAIGPFYEYGLPMATAAVKSGCKFIDICDDYEATEGILALDQEAKRAGAICVTGLGWTPGLSNLLAKLGHQRLGGCDEVSIAWLGSAADSKGLAVVMHLFYAITGEVPMLIDGKLQRVKAGSGKERKAFPPPMGEASVYFTGHPEPITLARSLKGVSNVYVKGGLTPDWQNALGRFFVWLRLTRTPPRRRRLAKAIHKIEDVFRAGGLALSAVRVDVKLGEETVTYAVVDKMANLTGIPAAVGALLLEGADRSRAGCYAPEDFFDAEPFLKACSERGLSFLQLEEGGWRGLVLD